MAFKSSMPAFKAVEPREEVSGAKAVAEAARAAKIASFMVDFFFADQVKR